MFKDLLRRLGIEENNSGACHGKWIENPSGGELVSYNPADGKPIARIQMASKEDYEVIRGEAEKAFKTWRMVPAPQRGEIIRQLGNALREHKEDLGMLVTLEMGKIKTEGEGEVQEMIDMCDFSVGLSRQLYGLTIQSERPEHRMFEQWQPLGVVGIISAFNFPVAVWAWNAAVAAVCGDTMIWKPSSETPLTALAVQHICNKIMEDNGVTGIFNLAIGRGSSVGETMVNDRKIPLISATGSCEMGYRIGAIVGKRLGNTILELGGNNAIILDKDANLDMALRAVLFAAVGTAGQRCTSLRRLIIHKDIEKAFTERLVKAYGSITIGDPWDKSMLMGPLVNEQAVETMMQALERIKEEGGTILAGGEKLDRDGFFVKPVIAKVKPEAEIVQEETFAPILYIHSFNDIEEAIEIHNNVVQGLSSAIFTNNLLNAETFLSARGSDCGIANVNIGTSGAEIGGAFGGEKETGGGREAGSDSWKAYMRRQTCTVNWGKTLPLAQGVEFDVDTE